MQYEDSMAVIIGREAYQNKKVVGLMAELSPW